MTPLVKWLYFLALSVWVGSKVFFSFVVAPTVFRVLKLEDAGRLQRALFPKYYLIGILCAAAGIVCVGLILADGAFGKWPAVLSLLLLASSGATEFWLRQSVVPQMNALRDQVYEARAANRTPEAAVDIQWKEMHRLSVQLNVAVLLCGLVLLFLIVFARVV